MASEVRTGTVREDVACYRRRGLAVCRIRPSQQLPGYNNWPATRQFRDPDGKMLVEFRGTGAQTVVPSSVWAGDDGTRETRCWDVPGDPAEIDCSELFAAVQKLATAAGWRPPLPAPPPRPSG